MSGLILHSFSSYSKIKKESYQKLETYNVKTIDTEYGIMSYVDEGSGETIIISHGIFGGYDQGYKNLRDYTFTYTSIVSFFSCLCIFSIIT